MKWEQVHRQESGQMMVLVSLLMTGLLGITALAVDAGFAYAQLQRAQSAADTAALAGAVHMHKLGHCTSAAQISAVESVAKDYAKHSGFDDADLDIEVDVDCPYGGDANRVKVEVERELSGFFLGAVFAGVLKPKAEAVGGFAPGCPTFTLFAGKDSGAADEDGIKISGSNNTVGGPVHSNQNVVLSGAGNTLDDIEADDNYDGPNGNTTGTVSDGGAGPMPIALTLADFASHAPHATLFTYRAGSVDLKSSDSTLVDGIHYNTLAGGLITIGDSGETATVTLIADAVTISGSNVNLTPYAHATLVYGTGSGSPTVSISGSNNTGGGLIFAPTGSVIISGSSGSTLDGMVYADTIEISGSNQTLTNASSYCPPAWLPT